MDTNCTVDSIDGETILYDVLDKVFSYLGIKDLSCASQVCRSWRYRAKQIMMKGYPEMTVVPNLFIENKPRNIIRVIHISDFLNIKPHMALLFSNYSLFQIINKFKEYEVFQKYKRQLPSKITIMLGVNDCFIDRTVHRKDEVLGLFLPSTLHLQIDHLHLSYDEYSNVRYDYDNLLNKVLKKLKINERTGYSVVIMFASINARALISVLTDDMNRRFKERTIQFNLCGMVVPTFITYDQNNTEVAFTALKLSGKNLKSWSFVINPLVELLQFKMEIKQLKNNMKLRGHTLGLMFAVDTFCPLATYVKELKETFPNFPFLTVINPSRLNIGTNSLKNSHINLGDIICVLILTYDNK